MTRRESLERREYWKSVIRQQGSSGVPISAFFRKHGVAEGSFFYWRRKLVNRQPQEEAVSKDKGPRPGRSRNHAVAKFVPVEIPVATGTTRASCEVVLPDGCRIIVPTQCDAGWLREILIALGDRTC